MAGEEERPYSVVSHGFPNGDPRWKYVTHACFRDLKGAMYFLAGLDVPVGMVAYVLHNVEGDEVQVPGSLKNGSPRGPAYEIRTHRHRRSVTVWRGASRAEGENLFGAWSAYTAGKKDTVAVELRDPAGETLEWAEFEGGVRVTC